MTFAGWTYLICGAIAVIGCLVAIRSSFNARRIRTPKGAKPGQGGTLVSSSIDTSFGASQSNVVISRDPQAYAKSMAPRTK